MFGFVLGIVAGAAAAYYWSDEIRRMGGRTRSMRTKAANALQTVGERAEELLDGAKEQVTTTLQAGQDALRPPPRH